MAIPHSVLAGGWIPFVIVLLLILIFSFVYIRIYQSKYDKELSSTITSILALSVALVTSSLLPVDIFLVSFMKTPDGHFKPWASDPNDRRDIMNSVLYAYYALYICVTAFIFLILPFVYFFYEEKDEETTTKSRLCTALKFTVVFVFIATVLLVVGAFVPVKAPPTSNSTTWEKQVLFVLKEFASNDGEDALSFVISTLSLVGMLTLITYTAYGMSAWPVDLMKGSKGVKRERMTRTYERDDLQGQIQAIKDKYPDGRRMTSRDRRRLTDLEEQERLVARQERHLLDIEKNCLNKCSIVCRPFEVVFGVIFFLVALIIFISLLLTNIDKAMHSLGYKSGYALPRRTLPNPIDIVLVFSQQVFPLDYILMILFIMYFFFCSMGGIKQMGIWFCWLRMYKIRPGRTRPQGLLFMCMILMFIVLAINIIVYGITPQYSMFGSQHYIANITKVDPTTNSTTITHQKEPCTTAAPDDCVMTRMSLLLTRFFYKMWFFGACYYWASWVFIGVFVIGFIVAVVRKRRSAIDGAVEEDDFEESDDEDLIRA